MEEDDCTYMSEAELVKFLNGELGTELSIIIEEGTESHLEAAVTTVMVLVTIKATENLPAQSTQQCYDEITRLGRNILDKILKTNANRTRN